MKLKKRLTTWSMLFCGLLLAVSGAVPAFALTDQQARVPGYAGIEQNPDKFDFTGVPMKIPSSEVERFSNGKIKVGMVITKNNVDGMKNEFIRLTSPGVYNMVKKGMEIVVADYKPWPAPKAYAAATKGNAGKALITPDGNLKMKDGDWWAGGTPFMTVDEKDPRPASRPGTTRSMSMTATISPMMRAMHILSVRRASWSGPSAIPGTGFF